MQISLHSRDPTFRAYDLTLGDFIIFLGAGASAEFDVPITREMTERFLKRHPDRDHKRKIKSIKQALKRLDFSPNIENILSYVLGETNPKKALKNSSPYVASTCKRGFRGLGYKPSERKLANELRGFIADEYRVHQDARIEKIVECYSKFFEKVVARFDVPVSPEGALTSQSNIDIFTTNYDNVIEWYAKRKNIGFFEGYSLKGDDSWGYEPQAYQSDYPLKIYKLNGSVTLARILNKVNKFEAFAQRVEGFEVDDAYGEDWKIVDRLMIHGYEKDPTQEPYFDLLYLLKRRLLAAKEIIAVGYSFSDKSILNVFKDVLNYRGDGLNMTLIDPRADKIKKKIFNNDLRVHASNQKFDVSTTL